MGHFLSCVSLKLCFDRIGIDALCHKVMILVAQNADQLSSKRLIQQPDHFLAVSPVARGDGAFLDIFAGALTYVGSGYRTAPLRWQQKSYLWIVSFSSPYN